MAHILAALALLSSVQSPDGGSWPQFKRDGARTGDNCFRNLSE